MSKRRGLGTAPVFLTGISTILGAILFLRFGYAVGHTGLVGAIAIIIIGHCVTIPTAMAIAEIATNQKVEGGGEYFIISRSFGLRIGAAIGLCLYLSQAVSVAFYLIALATAFEPILQPAARYGISLGTALRVVGVLGLVCLGVLIFFRGASLGTTVLYFVVAVLFTSLALFFFGKPTYTPTQLWTGKIANSQPFWYVFAVVFPAFTGMTAGVGLSGDLREPRKSIPLGTMAATLLGMGVYVAIAWKFANSATPKDLAGDQFVMAKIAAWGPAIPIGLGCAALSSAIGTIMVAPRTLQALARDRILGSPAINRFLSRGDEASGEPRNALILTSAIALVFIIIGDVNFVAGIITMFFMVTYGSLCMVSFLEHFAGNPAYRPTFKSRWYLSLFSSVLCVVLMFLIQPYFAAGAIGFMVLVYLWISRRKPGHEGLADIFQGAIFQITRRLQVFLQKRQKNTSPAAWRPAVVCLSESSFQRYDAIDLMRWIARTYGFCTYIHLLRGYLSRSARDEADELLDDLIRIADISDSNVYFDTMVSPSYTTAIAQGLQLPGISGRANNGILFEFDRDEPDKLKDAVDNFQLIQATNFDIFVLGCSPRKFGYHREMHIWITETDYANANLMILMAYVIMGHPDWEGANLRIFDVTTKEKAGQQRKDMQELLHTGRLPVSEKNVELIIQKGDEHPRAIINRESARADLTLLGVSAELMRHTKSIEPYTGYDALGNILFVTTDRPLPIN